MKDLVKTIIVVALIWVFVVGILAFGMKITDSAESKPTLNLCSAETIRIGEDIEYVYVKVKK